MQLDLTGCAADVETVSMIAALVKKNRLAAVSPSKHACTGICARCVCLPLTGMDVQEGRDHGARLIRRLHAKFEAEQAKAAVLAEKAQRYKKKISMLQDEIKKSAWSAIGVRGVEKEEGYDSAGSHYDGNSDTRACRSVTSLGPGPSADILHGEVEVNGNAGGDSDDMSSWWDLVGLGTGLPLSAPALPASFGLFGGASEVTSENRRP